jgi:hypothetical protein
MKSVHRPIITRFSKTSDPESEHTKEVIALRLCSAGLGAFFSTKITLDELSSG